MIGLGGDDTFLASSGHDRYIGGSGTDTVDYSAAATGVDVHLLQGTASSTSTNNDTLISIENVIGSDTGETIVGNTAANQITGLGGADTFTGGGGNDQFIYLQPGEGGDTINDFDAGDLIVLSEEGLGDFDLSDGFAVDGDNFKSTNILYDGSNLGSAMTAYDNNEASLIYSTYDYTLYYDSNGATAGGYTSIAILGNGYGLAAGDIQINEYGI
jgi:Ca2+-binding RTX toxin-like protein